MERIDQIKKIERFLRKTWKYKLDESVNILAECQARIQKEIDIKTEKEKVKEQEIRERILRCRAEKEKIEEERRRIQRYKCIRYKKPLPSLEDRRQYVRFCRKCKKYYRTFAKYGQICDSCKTGGVSDEVPNDLQSKKYKKVKRINGLTG